MSAFVWVGNGAGTKTDMQDGRNWANLSGTAYAQAVYPGATADVNDELYFLNALAASAPITNCDFSAKVAFKSVIVGESFNGAIGATGGYFKFDMVASGVVDLNLAAAQDVYMEGSGTYGLNNLKQLDGPIYGKTLYLKGTQTAPLYMKGTTSVISGTIATSLTAAYVSSTLTDLTLTIAAGVTLPTTITHLGGTVTNSNAVTTLNSSAGVWNQVTGAITTLTGQGSTVNWTAGNITTANMYAGKLDGSASSAVRKIGTLNAYGTAVIDLDCGSDAIYIGSYAQVFGSTIRWPAGRKLEEYYTLTGDGGSNAIYGIAPQAVAGTPTTTVGSDVYLGQREKLDIHVQLGATDCTTCVFTAYESEDTAGHTSETAISGKEASFSAASKQALISITKDDLTVTKPVVRIKCVVTGGSASLISASYVKKTR